MAHATINDCWNEFQALHGSDRPEWSRDDLRDWIHARGLRYEQVTAELLGEAYDEELSGLAD